MRPQLDDRFASNTERRRAPIRQGNEVPLDLGRFQRVGDVEQPEQRPSPTITRPPSWTDALVVRTSTRFLAPGICFAIG
jgi:hypothetical protein